MHRLVLVEPLAGDYQGVLAQHGAAGGTIGLTMNATPLSPADLAKALSRRPRVVLPRVTRNRLDTTLRSLALRPTKVLEGSTSPNEHAVRFGCLLEEAPRASDIVAAWKQVLDEGMGITVSEAILLEGYFSTGSAVIPSLLPGGMRYLKTLQIIRERASIALHDYAREINWRRPVLFVQILKVARGYLRDIVGHTELTREEYRREFTGRLGVSTVLIGRFEAIDRQDAREAVEALRLSLEQGNAAETAVPYLLEAATLLFDAGGDARELETILEFGRACLAPKSFELSPTAQLAACDVYLRLASSSTGHDRLSALQAARSSIDTAVLLAADGDDKVAGKLMAALVTELDRDPTLLDTHSVVGLRLPFGIRTSMETPTLVKLFAAGLFEAIADQASSGDPLARGVCADLLELANTSVADPVALKRIIEFRAGNRRRDPLADERSRLLSLRDKLLVAKAEADARQRGEVVKELILMSVAAPASASPILLIAQDVEANGPVELLSETADSGSVIARAAVAGDWKELMRTAAGRAINNPDLSIAPMGGRSGVTTVGDYYGLVGQTFVFKDVYAVAVEREQRRAADLRAAINAAGRADDFLVSEHLDTVPLGADTVRSIRRFIPGRPVSIAAQEADHDERVTLLARTAEYLGFMNTVEEATQDGVRRELKVKEVGRWIRAIGVSEPIGHFDEWWTLVSDAGVTRRRDAHLDNWVLTSDGHLLALDLEAIGSRPVGYELAQITDDRVLLDPLDWDARRAIFDSYRAARGYTVGDQEIEWSSYEASLAARAVGKLTWSDASPEQQEHARALLEEIAARGVEEGLRKWARASLDAWRRQRGLADLSSGELDMDRHRRRRVSKAMAYHLRHGEAIKVDPDGWVSLAELAAAIGGGVTENEIAIVASTLSEPRFEFRDNLVRARYGHTRNILHISSQSGDLSDVRAYHATNLESAHRIIELAEGLKPMERQFVHLSKDRLEALRSGLRHGAPLLLSAAASQISGAMVAAGNTLVAPAVSSELLRVEPISTYWDLVPRLPAT
jgi:RNA:NAD 2'-phosphotransferase (TPT1/KptA family)